MKQYDTYKESGIEWIGETPSHWGEVSIKWVSKIFAGGTPSKDKDEYWYGGNIPWLNSGSVNQGYIVEPSEFITKLGFEKSSAKWISTGSLLIALAGQGKTKGMVAQLGIDATCNQSMAAIIPNTEVEARYLLYWLHSNYQNIRNLGGGDLRDGLNLEMIGSIKSPIPTSVEQIAIATYLDRKTAEIDALITDKKRLLELYEEEKTAVINQAVTKGINPKAKMKDSGIEWMGKVPEHWKVKRLKYIAKINPTKNQAFKDATENVVFLPMEKVNEDGGFDEELMKPVYELWNGYTYFERGDIIIAKITPCFENGKGALLSNLKTDFGFGSTEFHVIRTHSVDSAFLYYVTRSEVFMKIGEAFMTGAAGQKRVPTDFVSEFLFAFPQQKEQQSIVHHIETECTRIDAKIAKTQKLIELLTEYRTALISEVVTGKIKVID